MGKIPRLEIIAFGASKVVVDAAVEAYKTVFAHRQPQNLNYIRTFCIDGEQRGPSDLLLGGGGVALATFEASTHMLTLLTANVQPVVELTRDPKGFRQIVSMASTLAFDAQPREGQMAVLIAQTDYQAVGEDPGVPRFFFQRVSSQRFI